jgi:hypothetical protein
MNDRKNFQILFATLFYFIQNFTRLVSVTTPQYFVGQAFLAEEILFSNIIQGAGLTITITQL